METVRIDIWRLTRNFLLGFILPLGMALFVDLYWGWMPLVTIAASILFIPLGTVIVIRTALLEFDKVIAQVAPEDDSEVGIMSSEIELGITHT